MRLHIFNPEHDLVLAATEGGKNYTPPRAAVALRRDLGYLPAFWAGEGDVVLVDDVERARALAAPFKEHFRHPLFLSDDGVREWVRKGVLEWEVLPWGWDCNVKRRLLRDGMPLSALPSEEELAHVRHLSDRTTSVALLHEMVGRWQLALGERWVARSMEEVKALLADKGALVLKAPWSSTGRGVRFVAEKLSASEEGFVAHTLDVQRSIIVEPHYDRVLDFAMEFEVAPGGCPHYSGLSVFDTDGAGYVGGMLVSEAEKLRVVGAYLPLPLLEEVKAHVLDWLRHTAGRLVGPVGVDMMVVRTADGWRLHPCVEVNVRRTMGHVAISIAQRMQGAVQRMAIHFEKGNYQLNII